MGLAQTSYKNGPGARSLTHTKQTTAAKHEPSISHGYGPPTYCGEDAGDEGMEVMMNALKRQVSNDLDDLVNKTDSPFTTSVNSFPLPQKFRMPQIESYNGVNDPLDHLETFKTLMHL